MKNKLFVIEENPRHIKESHLSDHNFKDNFSFLENNTAKCEFIKTNINKLYVGIYFLFIFFIILIFCVRLFYLQIIQGKEWRVLAEGNRIRIEKQIPDRGVVFDRNEQILVKNTPNFSLWFIPAYITNDSKARQEILDFLSSKFLDFNKEKIENQILASNSLSYEPVEILNNIPYNIAITIIIDINNYPGLRLIPLTRREYINNNYGLGQVLGYLGKINSDEWDDLNNSNYLFLDLIGKS